jgi:hypothetical protein
MKTMTKKIMFTALLFTLFAGLTFADGKDPKNNKSNVKKLSCQVIDQVTGETLAGVKVYIAGTDKIVYTDFDGVFQLEYEMNTEPQISVTLISYEGKVLKISDLEPGKINLERQK